MKEICRAICGSRLYKLNTPESDTDYRSVYLTGDLSSLVGLTTDESKVSITEEEDNQAHELRQYMRQLRKTNTNSIELVYAPDTAFIHLGEVFKEIRANKEKLICSKNLFNSTKGYVQTETRLALGERTGRLGSKRKNEIDKHGFSRKNVAQIIRIVAATKHFLKTGFYPVDLTDVDPRAFELAYSVKNHPEDFTKKQVEKIIEDQEKNFLTMEDKVGYTFDTNLATEIMWNAYKNHFTK
jgi:predicted nucleotidyltransferase